MTRQLQWAFSTLRGCWWLKGLKGEPWLYPSLMWHWHVNRINISQPQLKPGEQRQLSNDSMPENHVVFLLRITQKDCLVVLSRPSYSGHPGPAKSKTTKISGQQDWAWETYDHSHSNHAAAGDQASTEQAFSVAVTSAWIRARGIWCRAHEVWAEIPSLVESTVACRRKRQWEAVLSWFLHPEET